MEVRFRPMQPSTLAREVKSSRSSTEDGESFMEVVESLTSADQTPEQDPDTGGSKQPPPWSAPHASHGPTESAQNPGEQTIPETLEDTPGDPASQSPDTTDPDEKPLGARLDLTA